MNQVSVLTKRKNIRNIINELMKKNNLTMHQLSKNTGLANTTINRMCTDPNLNPTMTSIVKISEFFCITPNQLMGEDPLPDGKNEYNPNFKEWSKVPILTLEQVVIWPENIDEINESENTEYTLTDLEINEQIFAIKVTDNLLEPQFFNGTILIFDPNQKPKSRNYVILLMEGAMVPLFRQIIIDGQDLYVKMINELSATPPSLLKKNSFKLLGILKQAQANYT